jgi:carbohydrate-selective porin OprB
VVASHRLEITAGELAVTDLLDLNRYANSTRSQFENWGLFQNTAWDYAADTRGYSWGVAVAWIEPRWALRASSFQMPTFANGNVLDGDLARARGDAVELTLQPAAGAGPVVRVLSYLNHARMGSYAEAIAIAQGTGQPPDIVADDRPGRIRYGFGLNLEQPLADSGATGAFARLGWSDGRNESFAFTEVDRHVSAGVQVSGSHWRRAADIVAVAFVDHGLSPLHREYLALGGHGFLLGDGRLNYGHERIVEAYYRLQLGPFVQLSPDLQQIWNPGYNRDRGPATVLGLRVNMRY